MDAELMGLAFGGTWSWTRSSGHTADPFHHVTWEGGECHHAHHAAQPNQGKGRSRSLCSACILRASAAASAASALRSSSRI